MSESILAIVTVTASIVTVCAALRGFLKGPHVTFSVKKTETSFYYKEHEEKITLLIAAVVNKRKFWFGDCAKKVSATVLYRSPVDDKIELNTSVNLPWLKPFTTCTRVPKQLRLEEDVRRALEDHLFDRKEMDIPQGRAECLAIAYGIEKTNKLFLASEPPIEISLPPPETRQETFTFFAFRLEVAGENLKSTVSEGTVIMANSWSNWSVPSEVRTIMTPSKIRNLLLHIGFGQKKKVIHVDS